MSGEYTAGYVGQPAIALCSRIRDFRRDLRFRPQAQSEPRSRVHYRVRDGRQSWRQLAVCSVSHRRMGRLRPTGPSGAEGTACPHRDSPLLDIELRRTVRGGKGSVCRTRLILYVWDTKYAREDNKVRLSLAHIPWAKITKPRQFSRGSPGRGFERWGLGLPLPLETGSRSRPSAASPRSHRSSRFRCGAVPNPR